MTSCNPHIAPTARSWTRALACTTLSTRR